MLVLRVVLRPIGGASEWTHWRSDGFERWGGRVPIPAGTAPRGPEGQSKRSTSGPDGRDRVGYSGTGSRARYGVRATRKLRGDAMDLGSGSAEQSGEGGIQRGAVGHVTQGRSSWLERYLPLPMQALTAEGVP